MKTRPPWSSAGRFQEVVSLTPLLLHRKPLRTDPATFKLSLHTSVLPITIQRDKFHLPWRALCRLVPDCDEPSFLAIQKCNSDFPCGAGRANSFFGSCGWKAASTPQYATPPLRYGRRSDMEGEFKSLMLTVSCTEWSLGRDFALSGEQCVTNGQPRQPG